MNKSILFIVTMLSIVNLHAQSHSLSKDTLFLQRVDSLAYYADCFLKLDVPETVKKNQNAKFIDLFRYLLEDPRTFKAGFNQLKSISSLKNEAAKVAVYTWFTLSQDGYKAHGIVQKISKNSPQTAIVTVLKSNNWPKRGVQYSTLSADSWFGTLYYAMQWINFKDQTYFVLLGFNAGNGLVKKKVIDILQFNSNGRPQFGAPLFFDEKNRMQNRVIFKYSANASMSLTFNEKKNAIIFDHLSPSNPALKGNFMHYGPDFSYDRYNLKKGKWYLDIDFEAKNATENLGKKGKVLEFKPPPDSIELQSN